jgi:hypothetical protein
MMLRGLTAVLTIVTAASTAAMATFATVPAAAAGTSVPEAGATTQDGQLVSDFPLLGTPHVMNGAVLGITQIGDTIVAVGSFTRVSPASTYHDTRDDLTRRGVFAFDAQTGVIDRSFDVSLRGGAATAIDSDGTDLYVAGNFTSVNGQRGHQRLVKLTPSGTVVSAFRASAPAEVETLVVRGKRVYVGGAFDSVSSAGRTYARQSLAAVATADGAVLSSVRVPFSGVYTKRLGRSMVRVIDVTADGTRLVAIGNFTKVGGRARAHVAVLDTSGARAVVTGWHTARFGARHNECNQRFGSFVRDVDLAPDGTWFVVATTGGYGGGLRTGTLCDTTSRWSMSSGRRPVWVDYTGGDTTNGVEIAGGAVYVGGHMRWENNPFASAHRGPGAVPREGIAALDSATGLPLSWNPGRPRGVGAQAFLATADGLWIGSDTTLLANQRRGRIALMPWEGGRAIPHVAPAQLPNDLFVAPRRGDLRQWPVDESGAPSGSAQDVPTDLDWSKVRGAAYLNGEVYYGWAEGGLFRRTFDPATGHLGRRHRVSTRGLPFPSRRLTGMFYEPVRHRLYYTQAGDGRLFFRDFSPESRVLGAVRHVADRDRMSFAHVAGMTLAGGWIVYGSRDGALRSVAFHGDRIAGRAHRLSSDGTWRARALFMPND